MAKMNAGVVTNGGQHLVALCLSMGDKIRFTRMEASNAVYDGADLTALSELTSVKQRGFVNETKILDDGTMVATCPLINTDLVEDYRAQTVGLFATIGNLPEVLFSVSTAIEPAYIPAFNGRTPSGLFLKMYTRVSNTDNFSVEVDAAAIATVGQINELRAYADTQLSNKANEDDMQIALENKLGKTAKAADASKLNGQTASYYAVASTVNSALAQKANIGALGWIDIRLSTGWRITDGRTFQYSRTPFEIGIISGSFCKENSPKPVKGELVATLPAGYRPPSSIVLYSTYLQHNYNFILSPDGKITVSTSNTDAAISGYSLGGGLSVNTTYPIGG